jgi:hypothetical protein
MKTTLIALAAAALAIAAPSFASAKTAMCALYKNGNYLMKSEDCKFHLNGPRGSFQISGDYKADLTRGIAYIDVKITRPGMGVVYARLSSGRYVRWGAVRASTEHRGCWKGRDAGGQLIVCAL